jgi:hypothetical protein
MSSSVATTDDRRAVEPLAEALRERKLKVFKDDWYLRPDVPARARPADSPRATECGLRPCGRR